MRTWFHKTDGLDPGHYVEVLMLGRTIDGKILIMLPDGRERTVKEKEILETVGCPSFGQELRD